jgi:hypothetical protein
MTSWIGHPRLRLIIDHIVKDLSPKGYRFRRVEPVVFLCGGENSPRRETLRKYLEKKHPELNIFYAERVWDVIAADPGLSSLKMEGDLASLSDMVVVIVESPGTFAELGAFSHVPALRKKLLPIVDKKYISSTSFIRTGPLRWIDDDSEFKPTIYVPLARILESVDEIEARLARIPLQRAVKLSDLTTSPKHLLFFLCDLVAVITPATLATIAHFLNRIAPGISSMGIDVGTLVGLGVAMGLLRENSVISGGIASAFFSPAKKDALEHPYHRIAWVNLPSLRAEFLSALMSIPEAAAIMTEVNTGR